MSTVPDFAQHADANTNEDILKRVATLSAQLADRELSLKQLKYQVKDTEEEIQKIKRELLPAALNEAGVALVKTKAGDIVEVQDKIHASINKGREMDAFAGMVKAEMEDPDCSPALATKIVEASWKEEFLLKELSAEEVQTLIDLGLPFERKKAIHYQTLGKWVRGAIGRGLTIPPAINKFQYQEAKITRR